MRTLSKYWSLVLLFALLSRPVFSQDIITLKTGDEVKAIVTEVDASLIKYKKYENPTGPEYLVEKSYVSIIKYANGTKDIFSQPAINSTDTTSKAAANATVQQMPKPPVTEIVRLIYKNGVVYAKDQMLDKDKCWILFSKNTQVLQLYNSGQKLVTIGKILIGADLAYALGMGVLINNGTISAHFPGTAAFVFAGIAAGWLVSSAIIISSGRHKIKKAVSLYNASLQTN
jgi:hypothetical protein